jgi:hypothetical protein
MLASTSATSCLPIRRSTPRVQHQVSENEHRTGSVAVVSRISRVDCCRCYNGPVLQQHRVSVQPPFMDLVDVSRPCGAVVVAEECPLALRVVLGSSNKSRRKWLEKDAPTERYSIGSHMWLGFKPKQVRIRFNIILTYKLITRK